MDRRDPTGTCAAQAGGRFWRMRGRWILLHRYKSSGGCMPGGSSCSHLNPVPLNDRSTIRRTSKSWRCGALLPTILVRQSPSDTDRVGEETRVTTRKGAEARERNTRTRSSVSNVIKAMLRDPARSSLAGDSARHLSRGHPRLGTLCSGIRCSTRHAIHTRSYQPTNKRNSRTELDLMKVAD